MPWTGRLVILALMVGVSTADAAPLDRIRGAAGNVPDSPELDEREANKNVAPGAHAVGFQDADDGLNCDPVAARFGECIEYVDFMDTEHAWEVGTPRPPLRRDEAEERKAFEEDNPELKKERVAHNRARNKATWHNTSELYAQAWEDVAFRWGLDDDLSSTTLNDAGFTALPTTADTWDATTPRHGGVWSLPDETMWMPRDYWMSPLSGPDDAPEPIFANVRYHTDDVDHTPDVVLMSGRYAVRLGYDGELYDHDIMAGDPDFSGPFYEQMYPYESPGDYKLDQAGLIVQAISKKDEETPRTELVDLRAKTFEVETAGVPTFSELESYAGREFRSFSRLLQVQIAQFALEEYTSNHIRVLTALAAMIYPPDTTRVRGRSATRLNPGSRGETDTLEDIAASLGNPLYSVEGGFDIQYSVLPDNLVDEYLVNLNRKVIPDADFLRDLALYTVQDAPAAFDTMPPPPGSVLPDELSTWVNTHATGSQRDVVLPMVKRTALSMMVWSLKAEERDQRESWLLLDHVTQSIASVFDATEGLRVTPNDLVGASSGQWETSLGSHGYRSSLMTQGLGAIDPTAVCSTGEGIEAQDEPAFGAITVDFLVDAPAWLGDANKDGKVDNDQGKGKVLWEVREDIPFVMMDDPTQTRPDIEQLVLLPGDRAIYRVRWKIWTGWHILWTADELPTIDDYTSGVKMSFKTAAFCDDMVMAPRHLVPTLVRAGLLQKEFYPTEPITKLQGWDRIESWPRVVGAPLLFLRNPQEREAAKTERSERKPPDGAHEYLAAIARDPMQQEAQQDGSLLLFVFDSSAPEPGLRRLRDVRPRTPYARKRKRAWGAGGVVSTSGWTWFVNAETPEEFGPSIFPAYDQTESVDANATAPRWSRVKTNDVTIAAGVAGIPMRQVDYQCRNNASDLDIVAPCDDEQETHNLYSSGVSVDVGTYLTRWWQHDYRFAWELGAELHLDMTTPGSYWLDGVDRAPPVGSDAPSVETPNYAFTLRPQVGPMVGLRYSPDARPLHRISQSGVPWGADRADGTTDVGRYQYGLRAGALIGPGYNGLESTLVAEAWLSTMIRNKSGPYASFTPYHPGFMLGGYVRYQYGFLAQENGGDVSRYYQLDASHTVVVGVRGQYRVRRNQNEPEVPGL